MWEKYFQTQLLIFWQALLNVWMPWFPYTSIWILYWIQSLLLARGFLGRSITNSLNRILVVKLLWVVSFDDFRENCLGLFGSVISSVGNVVCRERAQKSKHLLRFLVTINGTWSLFAPWSYVLLMFLPTEKCSQDSKLWNTNTSDASNSTRRFSHKTKVSCTHSHYRYFTTQ